MSPEFEALPHYWQSRATRARLGFSTLSIFESFAADSAGTQGVSSSPIYELYLRLSYAVGLESYGETNAALDLLAEAVELAVPQKILGPFLTDDALLDLLRGLRDRYLRDEQQLIALRFVDDALIRATALRPNKLPEMFSGREMDVLNNLLKGLSNKEIARALELTENTVKFHLKKIFTKLGIKRRTQAIARAQELGLTVTLKRDP